MHFPDSRLTPGREKGNVRCVTDTQGRAAGRESSGTLEERPPADRGRARLQPGPAGRRFRHVLCVYPYRSEIGPAGRFYPPLGLEIVAAALKPYCQSIDVIDLRWESKRTRDFIRPDTDLVCFSVNWSFEPESVREEIRSVPPEILTIVGGRHASEDPERWLADCPNVDMVVRGPGEVAIEEIALGRPPGEIAGVSYRLDGHLAHAPARRSDSIPDRFGPDRRLRRYSYTVDQPDFHTGLKFDTLASSVGCPYNCAFCSFSRNPWGVKRQWSARTPEAVVEELAGIDADLVAFVDDIFTYDMDRVSAICDLILSRGIRKKYIVNARIELARRPDVVRKMERAGFSLLLIGIESAQDKTLRSMRKGFDTRRLRELFRSLRATRMILHGYFIVGNIGESESEMLQIAPFARDLGLDSLSLCLLRNEAYSGIEEIVADTPGYHIAPDRGVYSDAYPQERLREIRNRIYREFYTARQLARLAGKLLRRRLLTPRIILQLPSLMWSALLGRFNPVPG